jgi:GntR family transcriptional regulator
MARPADLARALDDTARASDAITIDRKADVPVGVQLDWALSAQIRDGRLLPGQQLPTLRELAEATGLNVNTVRSVYRRLEQRGLIDSQHGSGTFVAAAPRRGAALSSIAAHAAHEARETGLDPREVAAALYVARDDDSDGAPLLRSGEDVGCSADETAVDAHERSGTERRRALREQIATLERTVAELEAEHPGVAPAPRRPRRGVGPALLGIEELTRVRAELIRRLTLVQAAIDGHVDDQRREREAAGAKQVARGAGRTSAKLPTPSDAAGSASAPKRKPRARPSARPAPAGG